MIRKCSLVLAFLCAVFGAYPQEGLPEGEVFAPFVSRLEAELRNNLIRLSWRDSGDVRGPVFVYRSEQPLGGPSSLPVPAEVPYGTGAYLDEAEKSGTLYYFVAASDEWGRKYILSIPNTNTVNLTVGPEQLPGYGSASASPQAASRPASMVENISVKTEDDRVIISFSGAEAGKNLILYRSLGPLRRREDLLEAVIIRQRVRSPVIDHPLPGITYYYALVYEEDLGTGLAGLRPGGNASGAVTLPSRTARTGSREIPLPGVNLSGGFVPPPASSRGNETGAGRNGGGEQGRDGAGRSGGGERGRDERRDPARPPAFFPEDLRQGGTGEEYQLRTIVQGYFSLGEWEKAGEELRRFLQLPRTEPNRARARFYLGQVYYFQERGKDALFEFLAAQERYPAETNPWIQTVLTVLPK
ncbi:MAG: tetratricopeptide repeat protein [Treponema sp.]|jgi:hypothetical protein|nr:tetratricopeptide repeat protein [Treponema sp.]